MAEKILASSSSEIINDGPVLKLINKRLRALRKKLNRISQMEESLSQGKTLNKEQMEALRSKPSVVAGIDELEKLRQPMAEAVNQEIQLALEKNNQTSDTPIAEKTDEKGTVEVNSATMEIDSATMEIDSATVEANSGGLNEGVSVVFDLLSLVYFGILFDVRTLMMARDNMLTRMHERNSCLSYDYVTDDDSAGDPLKEWDLDLIATMGGLLNSRPVDLVLSHKDALQRCVEHAELWLAKSEQRVHPDSNITYAGLREKLNRIMASDYFTTTPRIRGPVEVATAVGNYAAFQVPVYGPVFPQIGFTIPLEGSAVEYEQEEEESPNSEGSDFYDDETGPVEELRQEGPEAESV